MQQEHTTRSALITGSGRNIGCAIALELEGLSSDCILDASSEWQPN